jgi:hypothetical protein
MLSGPTNRRLTAHRQPRNAKKAEQKLTFMFVRMADVVFAYADRNVNSTFSCATILKRSQSYACSASLITNFLRHDNPCGCEPLVRLVSCGMAETLPHRSERTALQYCSFCSSGAVRRKRFPPAFPVATLRRAAPCALYCASSINKSFRRFIKWGELAAPPAHG